MLAQVGLSEDLSRIAEAAVRSADPGEELTGIVPAEPAAGDRAYLCAYERGTAEPGWLVFDGSGHPVDSRTRVREVVSIAALCELADEVAAGGDLDELLERLAELRRTEGPAGVEEAEEAARALQAAIGSTPRVASPAHLDAVGVGSRRLERAFDDRDGSPFAEAMKHAIAAVERVRADVERNYKRELR
jgi:hypothetical protein